MSGVSGRAGEQLPPGTSIEQERGQELGPWVSWDLAGLGSTTGRETLAFPMSPGCADTEYRAEKALGI